MRARQREAEKDIVSRHIGNEDMSQDQIRKRVDETRHDGHDQQKS